jgi:hypothetical protein
MLGFHLGRTYEAQRLPEQERLTRSFAPPPNRGLAPQEREKSEAISQTGNAYARLGSWGGGS